jgi:CheY-like chemotaxis protein
MSTDLSQAEGLVNQELEPIVTRALQRFRALLPGEVELALHLVHEHPGIRADAARLEHALLSVFIVAWQSMGRQAAQIIVEMSEVLLDEVVLDPDAAKLQGGLPPRRYARLVVSNSSRRAVDHNHRLLAPSLVDDKPKGAHRLPLVEVHDIIVQHQGMFTVLPEPGRGTAFDIYLPTALPLETSGFDELELVVKHIFYVDDYEPMRTLVSETLPDAGFRVTCFESAKEALAALQHGDSPCDLVVTDYRLKVSSGLELLRQVKLIRNYLPVILISGYVDEALRSTARDQGAALVVSKTSDLSELCVALHNLLGRAPSPALVSYSEWGKL